MVRSHLSESSCLVGPRGATRIPPSPRARAAMPTRVGAPSLPTDADRRRPPGDRRCATTTRTPLAWLSTMPVDRRSFLTYAGGGLVVAAALPALAHADPVKLPPL